MYFLHHILGKVQYSLAEHRIKQILLRLEPPTLLKNNTLASVKASNKRFLRKELMVGISRSGTLELIDPILILKCVLMWLSFQTAF